MFRMCAMLFVAVIGFQFSSIVGNDQSELGAGLCTDFILYDTACPPGPGSVCENNKYDRLSSHLECQIREAALNAVAVTAFWGNCETYKDANDDYCPGPVPGQGNWRNQESGCIAFSCANPL